MLALNPVLWILIREKRGKDIENRKGFEMEIENGVM